MVEILGMRRERFDVDINWVEKEVVKVPLVNESEL